VNAAVKSDPVPETRVTQDPLPSAIADALGLMASVAGPTDEALAGLGARLALAHAAADDEINRLAVEGLQETVEDIAADPTPAHRTFLWGELATSLEGYALQLEIDARRGLR
jgi:hypothetical protein